MSAGYIIYSLDWGRFQSFVERPTKGQLNAVAGLLRDGLEEYEGEFDDHDPILEWPGDVKSLAQIAAKRLLLPDWYGDLSRMGKSLWEGVIVDACMNCDDIDLGFRVDNDGIYWDVIEIAWKHLGVVPDTISDVALSQFGTRPYRYHAPAGATTSRDEYERDREQQQASLDAIGSMLGQLVEGVLRGQMSPDHLLGQLDKDERVSQEHKEAFRDILADEDDEDGGSDFLDWSPMHSMHTPDEVRRMRDELLSAGPAMRSTKKKDARQQYADDLLPAVERIAADGRMLFIQVDT